MPGRDGTGPLGTGPVGRGRGGCVGDRSGRGQGRRFGSVEGRPGRPRNQGGRRRRRFYQQSEAQASARDK